MLKIWKQNINNCDYFLTHIFINFTVVAIKFKTVLHNLIRLSKMSKVILSCQIYRLLMDYIFLIWKLFRVRKKILKRVVLYIIYLKTDAQLLN